MLQMTFAACVRHKHIVMEIAVNAQAEVSPLKPLLGVLYDELARLLPDYLEPFTLTACHVWYVMQERLGRQGGEVGRWVRHREGSSRGELLYAGPSQEAAQHTVCGERDWLSSSEWLCAGE